MPHHGDDHSPASPQAPPALSQLCAEAILQWHASFGQDAAAERMTPDRFREYRATIAGFLSADRRCREVQEALAHLQWSGSFEFACGAPLPERLWWQVTAQCPRPAAPRTLGEAAHWILQGPPPKTPAEPPGDIRRVRIRSREDLFEAAWEFYADLRQEERLGIGGSHVLLSTSLQLWPHGERPLPDGTYEQPLARPEALGLRRLLPEEHPQGLIAAMRSGRLLVESVIGGPTDEAHNGPHSA